MNQNETEGAGLPEIDPVAAAMSEFRNAIEIASTTTAATVTTTDLVLSRGGVEAAKDMKLRLAQTHKAIAVAQKQALEAQRNAKAAVEAKRRELDAMMQAMNEQLVPLQKQMNRLQDGIRAVNLYMGRDQEIIPVYAGEPAPAETPITVRQTTLNMDEESTLLASTDGIDFEDLDLFIEWLQADRTHVDQLIPELKGVVAMRPRRSLQKAKSNDSYVEAEENGYSCWLIRNGEQLWLTTTDFMVSERVIPTSTEFTTMFETRDRDGHVHSLQPGSKEWLKAEERADAYTRHYMKVALVLQGVLDRTKLFYPLPPAGASFLEQAYYDNGTIRIIVDGENQLGVGRKPFFTWLKERNEALNTGMRIIGSFGGYGRGFRQYSDRKNYQRSNVRPEGNQPADGVYIIKRVDDAYFDFSFAFDRTEQIWDSATWSRRPAKNKASCSFSASDRFILPIDTITVEEIEDYLGARTERHAYATMFPLLQAALKFKKDEAAAEAPFRDALIAALATTDGYSDMDAVAASADELITWYKTANRWHRALDPEDVKASRLILTESKRRRSGVDKDAAALETIRDVVPDAMVVARRTSDYIAAIPETRRYPAPAVDQNVYVQLVIFSMSGKEKGRKTWVIPTKTQVAKWTVLDSDERWEIWNVGASPKTHLTDAEIDEVIAGIRGAYGGEATFLIRLSEKGPNNDTEQLAVRADLFRGRSHTTRNIHVYRDRDGLHTEVYRENADHHFGQRDEVDWKTRYWDYVKPENVIWRDEQLEIEALRIAGEIKSELDAARKLSDEAWTITRSIQTAWRNRWLDGEKARYVEDFGDDELWEEHLKTLKQPRYPYEDSPYGSRNHGLLFYAARRLIMDGRPPYGLTVREAMTEAEPLLTASDRLDSWKRERDLPADDILDLRFAEAKADI